MIEFFQKGFPMKKEKEFTPLIQLAEREKCIGNYGVSVANGSVGGGRVVGLDEGVEAITVHFSPFAALVQGEVRGRMECDMKFGKSAAPDKPPLSVGVQFIRCLVIEEGPESYLVLYPRPEDVIAEFRAAKAPS